MERISTVLNIFFLLFMLPLLTFAQPVKVGIVTDAPGQEFDLLTKQVKSEIEALTHGSEGAVFKEMTANWLPEKIRENIEAFLNDPETDIVVTLGFLSSEEAARLPSFPKPVIAATILDPELQNLPVQLDKNLGISHFSWIESPVRLKSDMDTFTRIFELVNLAVVIPRELYSEFPVLTTYLRDIENDFDVSFVPVEKYENLLDRLPAGTDGVMVFPLVQHSDEAIGELLSGLNEKGIPSLAVNGTAYLERGATITFTPQFTFQQVARQVAVRIIKAHEGTGIARLDDTDYIINYNKAEASLKSAEAKLTAARSAFVRVENLYVNNNVSLNEYEKAKMHFESAESMMKTVRSQLEAAQNQLDYTVLRAPFGGVVSSVMVKESEMTGAGHPVVVFASVNNLEVKTAVPENVIGKIRRGQDATVRFSAFPEETFDGIISEVSPGIPIASAYPVVVQLTESASRLFPGMTGTVELSLNGNDFSANRIVVAADAVGHDQTGDFVYVAAKSGEKDIYMAEKKYVTPGELHADGYEILSGLKRDERVITAGLSYLYDGRKVKLLSVEN